jgi:demethylmenaquinone methyltransferase / 2-methoxy-6-polyprenyl-1,4-benzoquinol methylase
MFDRIAPRYDLLNRLLSAGIDQSWRRAAGDLLALRGPARVLDLCTGTGDLLIELLRRDPSLTGVGVDLSTEMLARGAVKLARRSLDGRGAVLAGDGERLPVRGSCFDAAVAAFGIRNIGSPVEALREVHRVLKPGGRLVVLEFAMPTGRLGVIYRFYFGRILPRIGGALSGDPDAYAYLPASVDRFLGPEALGALLRDAGFAPVGWRPLTGGIAYLHYGDKPAVSASGAAA